MVCEQNLEMMIDLVEEEEVVLLGDYLDDSVSDIYMQSRSTSSPTTIRVLQA